MFLQLRCSMTFDLLIFCKWLCFSHVWIFPEDHFTQEVKTFTLMGVVAILKLSLSPRKFFLNMFSIFIYFLFLFWNLKMPSMQSLWINIFFPHDLFQLFIFFCFLGYVFSFIFEFLVLKASLLALNFQFLVPFGSVSF